jgi:hypothetical protein
VSLAALSLYRVTGIRRVPRPPTNDERIAAFRARVPDAPIGTPFRFRSRVYIPRPAFPRPAVATDSPSPNGAAAAGNLSTTRSNP